MWCTEEERWKLECAHSSDFRRQPKTVKGRTGWGGVGGGQKIKQVWNKNFLLQNERYAGRLTAWLSFWHTILPYVCAHIEHFYKYATMQYETPSQSHAVDRKNDGVMKYPAVPDRGITSLFFLTALLNVVFIFFFSIFIHFTHCRQWHNRIK